MGLRRKAREICVQSLYSLEFKETDEFLGHLEWINLYPSILKEYCDYEHIKTENQIYQFADYLIKGTLQNLDVIDDIIGKQAEHWDFENIALLDKQIMRIATYEMKFTDLYHAIIMNEAVEIAKRFCSEKSFVFINGILNGISKNVTVTKEKGENEG